MKKPFQILQLSENAITIDFGNTIDVEINEKVVDLYHALLRQSNKFWIDLIPAYASLTVIYDPIKINKPLNFIVLAIENISDNRVESKSKARLLKIPVCYDLTFALDALSTCKQKKISLEELITIHAQKTYHVFMIGFIPGFAYMGSVDSQIATPRLEKPRTLVPQGSVGIAGEQTGIYPLDSPGGWNIIGRTPVKLFDVEKSEPALFLPGDEVQFFSISMVEYKSFDMKKFNPVYER